jgi:hypothetical protein
VDLTERAELSLSLGEMWLTTQSYAQRYARSYHVQRCVDVSLLQDPTSQNVSGRVGVEPPFASVGGSQRVHADLDSSYVTMRDPPQRVGGLALASPECGP